MEVVNNATVTQQYAMVRACDCLDNLSAVVKLVCREPKLTLVSPPSDESTKAFFVKVFLNRLI